MRQLIEPGHLEKAEQLHAEAFVAAFHTDLIGDIAERRSSGEQRVLARRHVDVFKRAGVQCISDHVVGETFETQSFPLRDILTYLEGGRSYNPSFLKHSLKLLEYMLADLSESSDAFELATSVAAIESVARSGKIAVVLCTQGVSPVEDEPMLLRLFYRLGVRVVGLATYRGNAAVGSERLEPTVGLTRLGRQILAEASALRMVVDVSAVSKPGFWEIVGQSTAPIIASNTNVAAVCDHSGNFDDDRIKALADLGGVIGLIANAKLVKHGQATFVDFVDHIEHVCSLVGPDHVAVGPDIVEDTWYPLEAYRRVFQDVGFWSAAYPTGLASHSDLLNVTAEMLRRGFESEVIKKVIGGNVLRVYRQVWGE